MPSISVIIPFYKGMEHIGECVESVLAQGRDDVEIIVVDDCSPDGLGPQLDSLFAQAPSVRILHRAQNGGTLQARRDGVLASTGDYVLLIDQDDCLVDGSLDGIVALEQEKPVDILHFAAKVIAESPEAQDACAGMEGFLTPPERELAGSEILVQQFVETGGFDWHVHHKVYNGNFARRCWGLAGDDNLSLSDDIYLCFILSALAQSYRAIDAQWYEYHLGRGETLGKDLSFKQYARICDFEAQAFSLMQRFAALPEIAPLRSDWQERLNDVRDRQMFHIMNEMADNLAFSEREQAIAYALKAWPADVVAAELWRYVRDRAYGLFDARTIPEKNDDLFALIRQARLADKLIQNQPSARYVQMHAAAIQHINDLKSISEGMQALRLKLRVRAAWN